MSRDGAGAAALADRAVPPGGGGGAAALLARLGVDRAVGFTVLNRGWSVLSYPVTLYLVTTVLSREEQGYWFTFMSLLMLQVVVEMGVGTVLVQFASHEWAALRMAEGGRVEGDPAARARLASLARIGLRWYGAAALAFLLASASLGPLFLWRGGGGELLRAPWWLLCLTVALSLPLVPLRALLEGCGRVDRSQAIGLAAAALSAAAGWGAILGGAGLYALAAMNGALLAANAALLLPACRPFLRLLREEGAAGAVPFRGEFWPQQWRIAVSWACGYLMFYSFVPLVYHLRGAVDAGRMGASLSLFHAVNLFASSWSYPVGPRMGVLLARGDHAGLRDVVRSSLRKSLAVAALASAGGMALLAAAKGAGLPQAERFSDLPSLALLLLVAVALQVANVETTAARFQKVEPFLRLSVAGAALTGGLAWWLCAGHGIPGVAVAFALSMLLFQIPGVHMIYSRQVFAREA